MFDIVRLFLQVVITVHLLVFNTHRKESLRHRVTNILLLRSMSRSASFRIINEHAAAIHRQRSPLSLPMGSEVIYLHKQTKIK